MKRPQDKPHDGKTTSGAHPGVSPSRGGEDVGLLDQLAEFSVSAGEYASALEYYEQILSIAERARESSGLLAGVFLKMAHCRSQTGDYDAAVRLLDTALENLPEDAPDLDARLVPGGKRA